MSYRGRGRGGFSYNNNNQAMAIDGGSGSRPGQNSFNQQQQQINNHIQSNMIEVEVRGWHGGSMEDAVNFISRKTRVSLLNAVVDGDVLRGQVRSAKDAQSLVQWNGVRFAGYALNFRYNNSNNSGGSQTEDTIFILKQFLRSRYNPEMKLLALSAVAQDPLLTSKGLFASVSTSSKMFPALMKVASEENLDVETVDLSNNNLNDLAGVTTLAQTYPNLKNLSLQNNNITRIKSLEAWKNKMNHLRELVLVNNPIANDVSLKPEAMKFFPRLIILNGEMLRDENKLALLTKFPIATKQFFFEDEEIQALTTNFITNYLNLWDSNRNDLLGLYSPESQFSLSVDSSHPHEAVASSIGDTPWGYYLGNSRNLTKISNSKSRALKLSKGPEAISKVFNSMPKSKHDLINNPGLFSIESWRYPQIGGIMIVLHGEFEETAVPDIAPSPPGSAGNSSRGGRGGYRKSTPRIPLFKKSFERAFVVVPGSGGSMIIASDIMTLRFSAGSDAWKEKPVESVPSAVPTPQPSPAPHSTHNSPAPQGFPQLPPEIASKLNDLQKELIQRVMMETKLNLQYAAMLCEQSNWDYGACIMNFKSSVASIPPQAYQ